MDEILWWVGAVTAGAGTIGIVAFTITWSIDQVLRLTGFSKAMLQAYARLMSEKMHEKQIKEGRIPA